MFRTIFDTFTLLINLINDDWVAYHVTIWLFEVLGTSRITLAEQVKYFLVEYELTSKIIT
jgi:hypothetical protein